MSKKKKIFILVSMVVLLVVTGYLNVALNRKSNEVETTTAANFFTSCRADKLASRNYQLEIYNNIINTSTDAEEVASARVKRDEIAARVEEELVLESQIAARGYEDVIVTSSGESINVFVKTASGLTSDEVASILSILVRETGCSATQVKVSAIP